MFFPDVPLITGLIWTIEIDFVSDFLVYWDVTFTVIHHDKRTIRVCFPANALGEGCVRIKSLSSPIHEKGFSV